MPCRDDRGSGGTRRNGAVGGGGGADDGTSEAREVALVTGVTVATALLAGVTLVLANAWLKDLLLALPRTVAWTLAAGGSYFSIG